MRNLIVSPLMLVLFFTTLQAQSDTLEADDRYEIVGTTFYGVLDNETGTLVVDTIFPYVEIMDGPLFKVAYVHWNKDGHSGTLPQPVTEIYDADGEMVSRDYDALLQVGSSSYAEINRFARAFGLRDLEAAVAIQEGIGYEAVGKSREAYVKYKQAYRLYPQLTIAKEYADAIMTNMRMKQDSVKDVIRQEEYEREMRAARQQQLSATLDALAEGFSQLSVQNKQRKTQTYNNTTTRNQTTSSASQSGSRRSKSTAEALRDYRKSKRGRTEWRTVNCHRCGGSGRYGVCAACGGKGYRKDNAASRPVACGCGDGKSRCPTCYGKGTVQEKHTVYE